MKEPAVSAVVILSLSHRGYPGLGFPPLPTQAHRAGYFPSLDLVSPGNGRHRRFLFPGLLGHTRVAGCTRAPRGPTWNSPPPSYTSGESTLLGSTELMCSWPVIVFEGQMLGRSVSIFRQA